MHSTKMSAKDHILDAIIELSNVKGLRVTVEESLKGALLAGACAFAGGIVGGPIGLGVGGVIGSCVASYQGRGKYKPLAYVIMYEMSDEQKERLATHVQQAVQKVHTEDIVLLLMVLMRNSSLQDLIVNELKSFLLKEMRMRLL